VRHITDGCGDRYTRRDLPKRAHANSPRWCGALVAILSFQAFSGRPPFSLRVAPTLVLGMGAVVVAGAYGAVLARHPVRSD